VHVILLTNDKTQRLEYTTKHRQLKKRKRKLNNTEELVACQLQRHMMHDLQLECAYSNLVFHKKKEWTYDRSLKQTEDEVSLTSHSFVNYISWEFFHLVHEPSFLQMANVPIEKCP
jgi:hypothetical protein